LSLHPGQSIAQRHVYRRDQRPRATKKYSVTKLVYAEEFEQIEEAIAREKQLKGWKRVRKNDLVQAANPNWEELSF